MGRCFPFFGHCDPYWSNTPSYYSLPFKGEGYIEGGGYSGTGFRCAPYMGAKLRKIKHKYPPYTGNIQGVYMGDM